MKRSVDSLYVNGTVYTVSPTPASHQGMLVRDGVVWQVGDLHDLRSQSDSPREVDLAGLTVVPSFTDSHIHFLSFGLGLEMLALENLSLEETLELVAHADAHTKPGHWIIGRGFNFNDWDCGWPHKSWLDRVAPTCPVVLIGKDGHMLWVNSKALEVSQVDKNIADPAGGEVTRDESGELTGLLKETAMGLVMDNVPAPDADHCQKALKKAIATAHSYGITAVHNMEDALSWQALQTLRAREGFDFRVWLTVPQEQLSAACELGLAGGFGDRYLRFGGVKVFTDGSLGSRTAWMLEPYEGNGTTGIAVTPYEELEQVVTQANGCHIPVVVHAIGDKANRAVLDAIAAKGSLTLRNRIEHAQLLAAEDIGRFQALNVVASMQPTHCPQDRYMADAFWGRRSVNAYPFRSLWDTGAVLAFGSDCPVETCNVMQGLYSAVYRKRITEPESAPWYEEQALTIVEALQGFTTNAAYAASEEQWRGDLKPGMAADFVLLSHDILQDPEALPETKVEATYFEGKQVY